MDVSGRSQNLSMASTGEEGTITSALYEEMVARWDKLVVLPRTAPLPSTIPGLSKDMSSDASDIVESLRAMSARKGFRVVSGRMSR